jgi:hypothetical protein
MDPQCRDYAARLRELMKRLQHYAPGFGESNQTFAGLQGG